VLTFWAIAAALLRFINLGFLDLQGWDEGLYALRSKSIVQFGDWLDQTPHVIGGLAISCHPPLTFWTTAVLYHLFGASEFTTRLTSAMFGIGILFLLGALLRLIASPRASLFAVIILATNQFFTFFTRQGQLDVVYLFFVLLAVFGWVIWKQEQSLFGGLGMIALGTFGAFMSKALVGFYIPLILFGVEVVENWRTKSWRSAASVGVAALIGGLIALPWHTFMYFKHGKAFIHAFFFFHLVQRSLAALEGHNPALGVFFYINHLLVRFPESGLAIGLMVFLVIRRKEPNLLSSRLGRISCVWGGIVLLIISIMTTKIPQYMLPLSIPVAMLCGQALDALVEEKLSKGQAVVLLAFLSAVSVWSVGWPLRTFLKNTILGINEVSPYTMLSWHTLVVPIASILGLAAVWLARQTRNAVRACVVGLMFSFTFVASYEVVVRDISQYNLGTKQVADFLLEQHAHRVVYLGKDLNPALTLYLRGWENWKEDVTLDAYLSEETALAGARREIVPPHQGEIVLVVEEIRVAGKGFFSNLQAIIGMRPPALTVGAYRVYTSN
jgi:4-amino-4-deoxy-L-arabinose transferase-like glycosyltransferase